MMKYTDSSSIDAVVTWVDGNDLTHQRKRENAIRESLGQVTIPVAAGRDPTRFLDNGELRYCLASIHKFAPWIRSIHLITDEQTPDFLTPELQRQYNINLVNHRDIFRSHEWALPTFNSRTIETALWRIPDLAPEFVYFNDDFVLVSPVEPGDFFLNGKVILRGSWQRLVRYGPLRITINLVVNYLAKKLLGRTRTMHLKGQMEGARLAGFNSRYFRSTHVPHPLRTTTFSEYFGNHPEVFSKNISYRFRDMEQYWPISLANHLEILNGNAVLSDDTSLLIIVGEHQSAKTIGNILKDVENKKVKFLCLTALEQLNPSTTRHLATVMDRVLA